MSEWLTEKKWTEKHTQQIYKKKCRLRMDWPMCEIQEKRIKKKNYIKKTYNEHFEFYSAAKTRNSNRYHHVTLLSYMVLLPYNNKMNSSCVVVVVKLPCLQFFFRRFINSKESHKVGLCVPAYV